MSNKINFKNNNTKKTLLNNQKGVTIIMLIIAIVMMIIIVSFAVFNAQNSTEEAKFARAYSSLKAIKEACENATYLIEINPEEYDEQYFFGNNLKYNIDNNILQGITMSKIVTECGLTSETELSESTYLIKNAETDEEKRVLRNLELKGLEDVYVVDLENEKYYLLGGVSREDDTTYYEFRDIMLSYEMLTK